MRRIQGKKHKMRTYEINKISLSVFDDKRFVLDDGIHTLAYFHKDLKITGGHKLKSMCTKKFSIGGLIGYTSVLSIRGYHNFKPVYFCFYKKILRAQKHARANINQKNKIKQTLNNKGNNFSRRKTSKKVKVVCFTFLKKIKILLIVSFTILLSPVPQTDLASNSTTPIITRENQTLLCPISQTLP